MALPASAARADCERRPLAGLNRGTISLVMSGTPLRLKVWQALLAIPEGQLQSSPN
ncbi:hypothetical protein ACVBEH_03255 [Roseateles sp. GG27B]